MAKRKLQIIADANMPQVANVFATIGEVSLHAGRDISAHTLRNADVLLVRSVTQVNTQLLQGTPVKFVGTATAGVDHIAADIRTSTSLGFSDAKGCNANSVVEYVLACLAHASKAHNFNGLKQAVGIIGAGCVGSALAKRLKALGADVYSYDPFVSCTEAKQVSKLQGLQHCKLICVHTPLTHSGAEPTVDLVNAAFLDGLSEGSVVIAAGRGSVVNEAAILAAVKRGAVHYYADVWHQEPVLNENVVNAASIATPHVAGYSRDGKELATQYLYQKVCAYFGLNLEPPSEAILVKRQLSANSKLTGYAQFYDAVSQAWPVANDDMNLRAAIKTDNSGAAFDALRAAMQGRLEFSHYEITGLDTQAAALAALVNFSVKDS